MTTLEKDKHYCMICEVIVRSINILHAVNPFDKTQDIEGCPNCFSIDKFIPVCDEPGCKLVYSSGTPTDSGYRCTCYKHAPKVKAFV